ncbi:hypothetical protein ACFPH8_08085 [Bizionia hallyeonensis]|uniref:Branched-chain amino acid:cation transporter, LIVCS family n=1 Tax=Bizionia hallyeonensis TaxID=1123757 RepID=A0ABW0C6K2_9FLAO
MKGLQNFGKMTALISFGIGTSIFALYLYFGEPSFPIHLGFVFIIIAFIINITILTVLIGSAILNPKNRLESLKTCAIMLLNIPVVILYFYIVFPFLF